MDRFTRSIVTSCLSARPGEPRRSRRADHKQHQRAWLGHGLVTTNIDGGVRQEWIELGPATSNREAVSAVNVGEIHRQGKAIRRDEAGKRATCNLAKRGGKKCSSSGRADDAGQSAIGQLPGEQQDVCRIIKLKRTTRKILNNECTKHVRRPDLYEVMHTERRRIQRDVRKAVQKASKLNCCVLVARR